MVGAAALLSANEARAVPAVFFDSDLTQGRQNFVNVVNSTVGGGTAPTIFTLSLANTGSHFSVTNGSDTIFVTATRTGAPVGFDPQALTDLSVSVASWTEAVSEGLRLQFFSDAGRTTPHLLNAVGLEVNNWGTCCYTSGRQPDGSLGGSSVYMLFGATSSTPSENLVGTITSGAQRGTFSGPLAAGGGNVDNHFVAAIDDRNSFSEVTVVPNGNGEAFAAGGILHLSVVALNSVPAGSSSTILSAPPPAPITASSNAISALGVSLLYAFEGGTLDATASLSNNFEVRTTGGPGRLRVAGGDSVTFSGAFSGPGTLEKVGAGSLTLTGTNTHGATRATEGTLVAASAAHLGAGGLELAGGTLQLGGAFSRGGMTVSAGSALAAGSNTLTLTGALAGSGNLAVSGTGAGGLVLNAPGTFSGELTLSSGRLVLGATGALGSGSLRTTGSVVAFAGGVTNAAPITIASATTQLEVASGTATQSGAIGQDIAGRPVEKTGAGTLRLTGVNTFSGATSVTSGTLALAGAGSLAASSGVAVAAGASLDIADASGPVTLRALTGAGDVAMGSTSRSLAISHASGTFSGALSGNGSLEVSGGTQTLTGASGFTGATSVASGATLALSGAGSVAASSGVAVGGTFDISSTSAGASVSGVTGAGSLLLGARSLTLTAASGSFGGVVAGTGGLSVTGGTQTLAGTNSFTGATAIASGATLALTGTGSVAASSGVAANGTFDIAGTSGGASVRDLTGTGSVLLGARTLSLTAAAGSFGGVMSGAGGLSVTGGAQALGGGNSFTGATSVASGATLSLSGTGGVAASSGVAVGGTFDISSTFAGASVSGVTGAGSVLLGARTLTLTAASGSFGGVIGGTGGLTVTGGSQTLTGTNTYTGSTVVAAGGTLTLGAGGTTGSVGSVGPITVDGTLVFHRSDDVTVTNPLTGTGNLVNAGTGTTVLTNANTYTGSTQILAGSLVVGAGGSSGTLGAGPVSNNATLLLNRSDFVTLSNPINGTGELRHTGSGITDLTGMSSYTGATLVQSGTLRVNGNIASSSGVTVGSGGTLGGTGTVANTVVNAGGQLAPGNSIGTITVAGDLTLAPGSVYDVEFSVPAADRTNVTGAASLGGALRVVAVDGPFPVGTRHRILAAQGGVTGAFSAVQPPASGILPGTRFDTLYFPAAVDLVVTPLSFADLSGSGIGLSRNQRAVGHALDAVRPAAGARLSGRAADLFDTLYALPAGGVARALTELSGEAHTAVAPLAANAGQIFGRAMLDPFADGRTGAGFGACGPTLRDARAAAPGERSPLCAGPARVSAWLSPLGLAGNVDGHAGTGSGRRSETVGGVAAGLDVRLGANAVAGVAIAGLGANARVAEGRGRVSGDVVMAGIHAQARLGRLAVGAAAYGGAMDARVERTMGVMGNTILRGDTSPAIFGGRVQASYALIERAGATLAAYGSLDAAQVSRGATTEAVRGIGGNAPGVAVASRDSASARSEVGLQITAPVGLSTSVFARAGLASRLSSDEKVSAHLVGLPGSGFQVAGAREARQAAALSAGVETAVWRGARLGARVDARLGDGTSFVSGTARLRWEF